MLVNSLVCVTTRPVETDSELRLTGRVSPKGTGVAEEDTVAWRSGRNSSRIFRVNQSCRRIGLIASGLSDLEVTGLEPELRGDSSSRLYFLANVYESSPDS